MPENPLPKGLMEKLAQVDSKLDKLLAHQAHPDDEGLAEKLNLPEGEGCEEVGFTAWDDFAIERAGGSSGPPEDAAPFRTSVSAQEVDSIFQKVDKINRDAEVMERVEKLERQNRKIVILGAMFMSLVLVLVGASTFLLVHANLLNKEVFLQSWQKVDSPKSGEGAAKVNDPQPPQSIAGVQAPLPAEPIVKAEDPKPVAALSDPNPAEAIAPFKYVGSKTSDKYHYPGCKWAAEIKPEKLIHFSSTAEARKQGYIPCPTCQPPSSDRGKTGP